MRCIGKFVVRGALVTGLVGAVAIAAVGPDSVRAFVGQARGKMKAAVDAQISDPVALRAQLRSLEETYPQRIAEVRGDLAELNEQISQLDRELAVSRKVVAMADTDLNQMQSVLARAEEARTVGAAEVVKVRFDNSERAVNMDEAYSKANRVSQLRSAYGARVSDIERDLGYLGQQKERLAGLLTQLETERTQFQTQLWGLDRQVDAISRNDRMIEILQKRQDTIDNQSRYRAASLDQITGRLADIRAKQESKLEMFGQSSDIKNYENAAKFMLESEKLGESRQLKPARNRGIEIGPTIIEIGPESKTTGPIAAR
jgi:predicted RNase H-like nuclease (RuvC/YqgF family)